MADTLPKRLLALPSFQRELRRVTAASVREQFHLSGNATDHPEPHSDLNHLLSCASVLAHSSSGDCQDAALRIAHYCLSRAWATSVQKAAAGLILEMLTNRSAVALAISRRLLPKDYRDSFPAPLRVDSLRRDFEFTLVTYNDRPRSINRFQRDVWRGLDRASWLSLSAPTSSGKSFILQQAVVDLIRARAARHVVFLVPTRALIQELERDLRQLFAFAPEVRVTSVPQLASADEAGAVVYVFTQERLQLLLAEHPSISPDLLVVDEAQKIGEGARGVLLEQVIQEVSSRSSKLRAVFASPMTDNPEELLRLAPADQTRETVVSEQVTVNQNLLWVSQLPRRPKQWKVELCIGSETIDIGELELAETPAPASKRLPMVAFALGGKSSGNLVYVSGQADAEKTAHLLAGMSPREDDEELEAPGLQQVSTNPTALETIAMRSAASPCLDFGST